MYTGDQNVYKSMFKKKDCLILSERLLKLSAAEYIKYLREYFKFRFTKIYIIGLSCIEIMDSSVIKYWSGYLGTKLFRHLTT